MSVHADYAKVAAYQFVLLDRSSVSMKLRRLHRRFGIAAPQLVIRNQLPWQWILATSFFWLCILVASHWLDSAVDHADTRELRQEIQRLRSEVGELNVRSNTAGNVVNIEKATQQQLAQRIQSLERENTALKEDIRLFERLIPQAGDEGQIRIDSAQILKDGEAYRYRAVFGFRPSKQTPVFKGRLQLAVTLADGSTVLMPENRDHEAFALEVKNFARREGRLELPENVQPVSAEFRVLQGDTLRSKHTEPIRGSKDVRTQN